MAELKVRTGPVAYVEQQLEMLSPRDRRLLVGLVLFFSVMLVGGYWYMLNGLLDDKAARVRDAKESLLLVQQLDSEYRQHKGTFEAQESRLREYGQQPVAAWIEELATEHGIIEQLRQVKESASEPVSDVVKRTTYKVEIKRAPQKELYEFLHALETSPFPASVEESVFKTAFYKKEKFLDLTMNLTVLSLSGGS